MSIDIYDVESFLDSQDLDIRKKGNNPRFADQKCTPDVLCFIADMTLQLGDKIFIIKDIWTSNQFEKMAPIIFGKPPPSDKKAKSEYDKFISQNLELLAYAGVLTKYISKKPYHYEIINNTILDYVARSDIQAFHFLKLYFEKFLSDSNFMQDFDSFFQRQDKQSFAILKDRFTKFMQKNTAIGSRGSKNAGKIEIRRIFPKVLNTLAVPKFKGTSRGHVSKGIKTYRELMYNEENFRDVGKKEKHQTRKESADKQVLPPSKSQLIEEAKRIVRKLHSSSEVKDNLHGKTHHIHHIFPKNEFPLISTYKENLIALTAGQHLEKAHLDGNTFIADISYQEICLQAKKMTIEKNPQVYSKESFIHVINVGFQWIGTDRELSAGTSFEEIDEAITEYYKNI